MDSRGHYKAPGWSAVETEGHTLWASERGQLDVLSFSSCPGSMETEIIKQPKKRALEKHLTCAWHTVGAHHVLVKQPDLLHVTSPGHRPKVPLVREAPEKSSLWSWETTLCMECAHQRGPRGPAGSGKPQKTRDLTASRGVAGAELDLGKVGRESQGERAAGS